MSKYTVKDLWNEIYGKKEEVVDYAGRLMKKSACGNPNSQYEPTVDHIRPLSSGGKNIKGNLVICHWETNEEKGNQFPHWKGNDRRFKAIRKKGSKNAYDIIADR